MNFNNNEDIFAVLRQESIGGTDVSAICGLHPYKTAYDVYNEKVYGAKTLENTSMRLGQVFESGIGQLFSEVKNLPLYSPTKDYKTLRKVLPEELDSIFVEREAKEDLILRKGYYHATIDYFTQVDNEYAIVECKLITSRSFKTDIEFFEKYPHYNIQVQWYMYLTGFRKAFISTVQFNYGGHIKVYEVDYDEKLVERMIEQVDDFWNNHVVLRLPAWTNKNEKVLDKEKTDYVEAIDKDIKYYHKIKELDIAIADLEKEKKAIETYFKGRLDNSELLVNGLGETLVSYKTIRRTMFDTDKFKMKYPTEYKSFTKKIDTKRFLIHKNKQGE